MTAIRIWRYKRTGKVTRGTILKLIRCLAKAGVGVNLNAPKWSITAKRIR